MSPENELIESLMANRTIIGKTGRPVFNVSGETRIGSVHTKRKRKRSKNKRQTSKKMFVEWAWNVFLHYVALRPYRNFSDMSNLQPKFLVYREVCILLLLSTESLSQLCKRIKLMGNFSEWISRSFFAEVSGIDLKICTIWPEKKPKLLISHKNG